MNTTNMTPPNHSQAANPCPKDISAFCRDVRVAVFRSSFYVLVVYLATVCGCLSAELPASVTFWNAGLLTMLFLPFIYIYSVPFELATQEHFPFRGNGKSYIRGPYAPIGCLAAVFAAFCFVGLVFTFRDDYLPIVAYPFPIFLPYMLCQFLFASRYRLLQTQRALTTPSAEDEKNRPAWKSFMFWGPHIALVAATYVAFFVAAGMAEEGQSLATLSAIIAIMVFGSFVTVLAGDRSRRHTSVTKQFLFERTIAREPIALCCTLVLPYILGRVSAYHVSNPTDVSQWWSLSWHLSLKDGVVVLTLFALGLVFELMRYFANYHRGPVARANLSPAELTKRYRRSITRYYLIYVMAICLLPLALFLSNTSPWQYLPITIAVCILMWLGTSGLRPYDQMCFDDNNRPILPLTPRNWLVVLKVVGYLVLLTIFIWAYISEDWHGLGRPVPSGTLLVFCSIPCGTILALFAGFALLDIRQSGQPFRVPFFLALFFPSLVIAACMAMSAVWSIDPQAWLLDPVNQSPWNHLLYRLGYDGHSIYLSWSYVIIALAAAGGINSMRKTFES